MGAVWDAASRCVTVRATYVEIRAALAAARRDRRLSERAWQAARRELDGRWEELSIVELEPALAAAAGAACERLALRAGDGIQLAAALELRDPEVVLATHDARLRSAALTAGLAVAP